MKIIAICGSGLGSSFMVEMNIKKVLKKMGKEADVSHSDLASVMDSSGDLFVMGKDIAFSTNIPEDKLIVLKNIMSLLELETKLLEYFSK